jgi:hypothetical protein
MNVCVGVQGEGKRMKFKKIPTLGLMFSELIPL